MKVIAGSQHLNMNKFRKHTKKYNKKTDCLLTLILITLITLFSSVILTISLNLIFSIFYFSVQHVQNYLGNRFLRSIYFEHNF